MRAYRSPIIFFILSTCILLSPTGCARDVYQESSFLMGTYATITVAERGRGVEDAVAEAFSEMRRVERKMSPHIEGSELNLINASAGREDVEIDGEMALVIGEALRYGEITGGAFDITIAPLKSLWGFDGGEDGHVPKPEEIKAALSSVGYRKVTLNSSANSSASIRFSKDGVGIDLGGIAKGYAVDRAMEVLASHGIKDAIVNAGGDLMVRGTKFGRPWRVGIRHPRKGENDLLAIIEPGDRAVATSGDYERFFIEGGRRYNHIIDPSTGYPATGAISVTILSDSAMEADALATGVFVLGPERGLRLIDELPGVEGVIIYQSGERIAVALSEGLRGLKYKL